MPAVLFIAALLIFVQAFLLVKVACVALFLVVWAFRILGGASAPPLPRLVIFYFILAVIGAAWVLISLTHPGNYLEGITDAVRLYVVWSLAFGLLYCLLRARPSLVLFHRAMILAAVGIAVINLYGVADGLLGLGLIPDWVRVEMELYAAPKDGYWQITTNNIGALFVVLPYLVAVQFRTDAPRSWLTTLALLLAIITAAASGRRALWLVMAMTPCLVLALSIITGTLERFRPWSRRLLYSYAVVAVVGAVLLVSTPENANSLGYINHIQEAFSAVDERTIQKPYLIQGFAESPMLGSGFGAAAGYLRDWERPWAGYELTYYQMLFNLGAIGMGAMLALFGTYFVLVIRRFHRAPDGTAVPFGLLVAFVSLLLGAYSNRYFGSFDLLFFAGLLPYLASFHAWDHPT